MSVPTNAFQISTVQNWNKDTTGGGRPQISSDNLHAASSSSGYGPIKNDDLLHAVIGGQGTALNKVGEFRPIAAGTRCLVHYIDYPLCQQPIILATLPAAGKNQSPDLDPQGYDSKLCDYPDTKNHKKNSGYHIGKKALVVSNFDEDKFKETTERA